MTLSVYGAYTRAELRAEELRPKEAKDETESAEDSVSVSETESDDSTA